MAGMIGADVEQLRSLAATFTRSADRLGSIAATVGGTLASTPQWTGRDADHFRTQITSGVLPTLRAAQQALGVCAQLVTRNADEQVAASSAMGGPGAVGSMAAGVAGSMLAGAAGFASQVRFAAPVSPVDRAVGLMSGLLDVKGVYDAARDLGKIRSYSSLANSFMQASKLSKVSTAANSASFFTKDLALKESAGLLGKLGSWGKFLGAAGGVLSIAGGISSIINPQGDGARRTVDRVMGGLSVVGGVGTLAMAAGVLNPVGVAVVVGAGVVTGLWTAGTWVVDHWDGITRAAGNVAQFTSNGISTLAKGAKNAARAAGDAVGKAANAVGKGLSNAYKKASNFFGGLFK